MNMLYKSRIGKVILQVTYKLYFIIEIEYNKFRYLIFYIILIILILLYYVNYHFIICSPILYYFLYSMR